MADGQIVNDKSDVVDTPPRTNRAPTKTPPQLHEAPNEAPNIPRPDAEGALAELLESGDAFEGGSDGGEPQGDPPPRESTVMTDDTSDAEAIEEAFAEMFGETPDAAEGEPKDADAPAEHEPARLTEILGEDADLDAITATVKIDGEDVDVPLREALHGYQRQRDYTRKTQEVAKERKEIRQAADAIRAEAAQYQQKLQMIEQAFSDLGAPPEYIQRLNAEITRLQQARQADMQAHLVQHVAEQRKMLETAAPHIDGDRMEELKTFAIEGLGFEPQHMEQITDHRTVLLLDKAQRFDALAAEGNEVLRAKRKQRVKTLKPGGKRGTGKRRSSGKVKVPARSDGSLSKNAAADALSGLFS